jgi:3-hydroxy-3-methylglutaryl CoA synthase
MSGIVSYGAYIPRWRLARQLIAPGLRGERAVAGPDEDSLTMAVAATADCLSGLNREKVDALLFASTTSPFKEKQLSTTVAAAADLRQDIFTADVANSLKAGTAALKLGLDAIKAGSAKQVLVTAADCRLGAPGSDWEQSCGDGAAAFLIGEENVAIRIEASHSLSDEMFDTWRLDGDLFIRSWESRFGQTEGYLKVVREAVSAVMQKTGLTPRDFARLILYAADPRRATELARALGFDPSTQLQPLLFDVMGNTGTAYPLMLLIAALEQAKPGDRFLLASYGNGSDAFVLQVTEEIERVRGHRGIRGHLEPRRAISNYVTYLKWRGLVKMAESRVTHTITYPSAPSIWRERNRIFPLHGVKCRTCGAVQYPPQRVCAKCQAKDNFEEVRLSDKKGRIFSFSQDPMTGSLQGLVNFEGGGRILCYLADVEFEELETDLPVEMSFRKLELLRSDGIPVYFWKAVPVRA